MKRRSILSASLAAALLPPAAFAETVADSVFGADLLGGVKNPGLYFYAYVMSGETLKEPFHSEWRMDVRKVEPDGAKEVYFDLFSGPNLRHFGPVAAREQNPLILVFLQRDVASMGNLTGGAQGYFQQQIRRHFSAPAESEAVEVELDGRKIGARRYVMHPFRDDPSIARFPKFKDKAYEFVVSPEVPGGVYMIGSSTPDVDTGKVVLAETVTFSRLENAP